MNQRFFNKATKNEVVFGVHFTADRDEETELVSNLPADVIELEPTHPFFQPFDESKAVLINEDGEPEMIDSPVYAPTAPEALEIKKKTVLSEYTKTMEIVLADYPQAERDTFPEQAAEALAMQAVIDAAETPVDDDYPMIKNIAQQKGITTTEQKDKVCEKRNSFNVFCGAVTGKRHSLSAALDAIDLEAGDAIAQINAIDENSMNVLAAALLGA